MAFSIRKWASSLTLSFALVASGCREKEIQSIPYTPPAIIEQTIQNSLANTDTGAVALQDGQLFRYRLKYLLDRCNPADLQTLKDHNVTIALDQRLSAQSVSFFYPTAEAAYYRQGDAAVLSLWDDGKRECMDNKFYLEKMPEAVHLLAVRLRAGMQDEMLFAGCFKPKAGGDKRMEWRPPLEFSEKTFKKNPQLLSPPLQTLPGWTAGQAVLDKINPPVVHPTMKELKEQFRELRDDLRKLKGDKKKEPCSREKRTHEPGEKPPRTERPRREKDHSAKNERKEAMQDLKKSAGELKKQFAELKETLKHRKEIKQKRKEERQKRKAQRQALKNMTKCERKNLTPEQKKELGL